MKKKILLSVLTLLILVMGVKAQDVNIPDANFKAYLLGNTAINTNGDTEIQLSEASSFTGDINCTNQSISDLTGIEAFTGLDQLFCNSNALSTIDVTANTLLTRLDFNNNNVSTIDLSLNSLLKSLNCQSNQLQSVNLSTNIYLEQVDIRNNPITSLDIVYNVALIDLNCRNTSISSLNTTSNVNLTYLVCDQNTINSLDFSSNGSLLEVFCNDNSLTSLNIANGNNPSISYLDATNNSNLSCITVDDVSYSATNWTNIDAGASFSTNCPACTITIPDANFKAYLIGESSINTNGDSEIQCAEAIAFNGTIDCGYLNISDLTGIEEFSSLTTLNCYGNLFTNINLSSNVALTHLNCDDNSLSNLNISQNAVLTHLVCSNNSITSLDLSGNTALIELDCNWNSISSLDVDNNTALTHLICYNNALSTLDLSGNSSIVHIRCMDNQLNELNVANGNNLNFTTFFAYNNPNLACVTVDDESYSTTNWTGGEVDSQTSFSNDCSVFNGLVDVKTESVKIHPNPAQKELFLELEEGQINELVIVDYLGRVMTRITNHNANSIDVSDLKQGVYILKLSTENGVLVNQFVKN